MPSYDGFIVWADRTLDFRGDAGDEHKYDCPYCEAQAKLWANVSKGQFICYKCGEGGSLAKLVMDVASVTYAEAKKIIGEGADTKLTDWERNEAYATWTSQLKLPPPSLTPQFNPPGLLWHGNPAPDAVSEQIRAESEAAMLKRGFEPAFAQAMRTGYFVRGPYAHRTCLSVWRGGEFVWFQAWDHGKRFDKGRKYTNPLNTEVRYVRGELLYNMDRVASTDRLVVVEGIFNAWAVEQVGWPVVSAFGKHLSDFQLAWLGKHPAQQLILGLDPDAKAEAQWAADILRVRYGKPALLVEVPQGSDWNDLAPADRAAVLGAASEPSWFDSDIDSIINRP